ncbi:ATP-dependent zinc metalloprotease FtsH [Pseudonocardia zijingensis]|uniref:ATP-dependent zinc metalloprotease FtsH n=1 Tax=Pseudonocardia zijingensis TaxID=153376 RepID=A0ABN1Q264_9PSEU
MADQDRTRSDGPGGTPSERPLREVPNRPWRTEGLPRQGLPGQGDGGRRRRPDWGRLAPWLALGFLGMFLLLSAQDSQSRLPSVPYTEFTAQVQAGNVAEVFAQGETIDGTLRQPQPLPDQPDRTYRAFSTVRPAFAHDDLLADLQRTGVIVRATPVNQQRGVLANLLISLAPILLLLLLYSWMFRRQEQLMGGGLLGSGRRKPVDPETVRVTFDDVAGIDEVEEEISEVVDFLRDPGKYRRLGARVPKGVLLAGPPGTGKTLLARATAGEARVPFFSASASEFIEMIVGVGAQRVRELFSEARKVAPAIIFIDEIDTIGRARGRATAVGGHDEREQTLNQILTEMDGFSGAEGVVVLAATNRPDVLDPALLRPGRFDRTIMVHPPDQAGREAILRVHTRKVPLADDVDLAQLARATPGMTGADLANLVNEAAILAARRNLPAVGSTEFDQALEKVQLGRARSVVVPPEERRRTAYHESGHALLGMLQPGADPVRKVSIIPRGRALGATLSVPESDRYGYDEHYLRGRIIGALGGMAAEEIVFGVVTTGSENDLEVATRTARAMAGRWGMSDRIGPLSVLPQEGDPRTVASDALLDAVDAEVRRIIEECYTQARRTLTEHRTKLDAIVELLLERETLDETEVYAAAGIPRGGDTAAGDRRQLGPSESSAAAVPASTPGDEPGR